MQSFVKRNIGEVLLAVLLFVQVLMVGHQMRTPSGETRLRYWSSALLVPVLSTAQTALGAVSGSWRNYIELVDAREESRLIDAEADRLRIENHFLRQKLLRFENRQDLEAYRHDIASMTLGASVIARSPSRSTQDAVLNRGSRDGVARGMAVITSKGIVGKIEAVHGRSSIVLLINDLQAGVGAVLAESEEPGVLRGTSGDLCMLDYIGSHVRVAQGETVYTSGLDGVFPSGLPVGRVEWAESGTDMQRIAVKPFVALNRVSEVLIVTKSEHEVIPDDVLVRLRDLFPQTATRAGRAGRELARTDADRIKEAYRAAAASQGKRIGLLSGTGPPDLSSAAEDLNGYRATARKEAEESE